MQHATQQRPYAMSYTIRCHIKIFTQGKDHMLVYVLPKLSQCSWMHVYPIKVKTEWANTDQIYHRVMTKLKMCTSWCSAWRPSSSTRGPYNSLSDKAILDSASDWNVKTLLTRVNRVGTHQKSNRCLSNLFQDDLSFGIKDQHTNGNRGFINNPPGIWPAACHAHRPSTKSFNPLVDCPPLWNNVAVWDFKSKSSIPSLVPNRITLDMDCQRFGIRILSYRQMISLTSWLRDKSLADVNAAKFPLSLFIHRWHLDQKYNWATQTCTMLLIVVINQPWTKWICVHWADGLQEPLPVLEDADDSHIVSTKTIDKSASGTCGVADVICA